MDKLEVIDIETVAAVLRKSDRQIRTWISDFGCPCRKEGRSLTFYWPDVLNWYVEYASSKANGVSGDFAPDEAESEENESLQKAMLRKTRAEADLKQLALSKLRGEVIVIQDAKSRLDRMLGNLRSQLMSMAPKLATRIAGERDPNAQEAAIKDEMETLCRSLSTGAIAGVEHDLDGEDAVDIEAAAAEEITGEQVDAEVDRYLRNYMENYASV